MVRRTFRRAGCGREAIPEGGQGLASPPREPGVVVRHSRRAGRDQEEQKGLGVPPGGLEGMGGHLGEPGRVGRPSWSAGMDQESLPKGWQGQEGSRGMGGSGGPTGGLGGIRRPPWRAERGWVGRENMGDLPEVWEGSGSHPERP